MRATTGETGGRPTLAVSVRAATMGAAARRMRGVVPALVRAPSGAIVEEMLGDAIGVTARGMSNTAAPQMRLVLLLSAAIAQGLTSRRTIAHENRRSWCSRLHHLIWSSSPKRSNLP